MSYVLRGVGIAPPECAAGSSVWCGTATDCSKTASWLANPECWGYSPSAWAQMGQLAAPAVPATTAGAAIPAGYTATATDDWDMASQAAAANTAAVAANQAAALAAAQNQGALPVSDTSGSVLNLFGLAIPWWTWALVGVGAVILVRKATS